MFEGSAVITADERTFDRVFEVAAGQLVYGFKASSWTWKLTARS